MIVTSLLWSPRFARRPADPAAVIPPGVHVIHGDSAGGALKATGAALIVCVPDTLTVGPASRTPVRHARLRERFWQAEYGRLRSKSTEDDTAPDPGLLSSRNLVARILEGAGNRIIVWASGSWEDLLFLGWAIDGLRREKVSLDRVWLAAALTQAAPLGWAHPEQLKPIGGGAKPIRNAQVRALASLWDAFTFPDPSRIENLRRDPPASLPTLRRGLSLYAAFLPRAEGPGCLRLSAVDEALLASLSEREFRRIPDLFRTPPSRARWPTSALHAMLVHFGDLFIEARLAEWSEGRRAAVETRVAREPRYPTAWRLTARGHALLNHGLRDRFDVPRYAIGGYHSNRAPWACIQSGRAWRLERLGRQR